MFGQGFKRMDAVKVAGDGVYKVTLVGTTIKERNGFTFMEFSFKYNDGEEKLPNTFTLFENTPSQGQKGYEDFCRKATRIFDCFDIEEGFTPQIMQKWVGHEGTIEIGKDSKGFATVKKFLPSLAAEERRRMNEQKEMDFGKPEDIY